MGKLTFATGIISHTLAVTQQLEFIAKQSIQSHRAPGVEFAGADAHFGTETKAEAVAEAGGAVPEDAGGIHQGHKGFSGGFGRGQDHIGMAGAVGIDMVNGGMEIRDNFD